MFKSSCCTILYLFSALLLSDYCYEGKTADYGVGNIIKLCLNTENISSVTVIKSGYTQIFFGKFQKNGTINSEIICSKKINISIRKPSTYGSYPNEVLREYDRRRLNSFFFLSIDSSIYHLFKGKNIYLASKLQSTPNKILINNPLLRVNVNATNISGQVDDITLSFEIPNLPHMINFKIKKGKSYDSDIVISHKQIVDTMRLQFAEGKVILNSPILSSEKIILK